MNPTSAPLSLNYSCISYEEENPDSASIFKPWPRLTSLINRTSIGPVWCFWWRLTPIWNCALSVKYLQEAHPLYHTRMDGPAAFCLKHCVWTFTLHLLPGCAMTITPQQTSECHSAPAILLLTYLNTRTVFLLHLRGIINIKHLHLLSTERHARKHKHTHKRSNNTKPRWKTAAGLSIIEVTVAMVTVTVGFGTEKRACVYLCVCVCVRAGKGMNRRGFRKTKSQQTKESSL